MKVYIIIWDGHYINQKGHTSLRSACEKAGVSYQSAIRGKKKRLWFLGERMVRIQEVTIEKIPGRGKNGRFESL